MGKVKFLLPDPRVVPLPDGTVATVERGDVLETTDEHARALARQQEVWEAVADKPAPDKKKEG